jgi:hypothetical protein
VGRPLWLEGGSVVYNSCWPSPAQPFLGPSPAGLGPKNVPSQIRDSSNLVGQVPVFIFPRDRVAQSQFNEIMYKNSVRTSQETHYVSATKPNRLMLFREIIAVYCENRTKHINRVCGQNVEFFNIKASGIYSYHCSLKGLTTLLAETNYATRTNQPHGRESLDNPQMLSY